MKSGASDPFADDSAEESDSENEDSTTDAQPQDKTQSQNETQSQPNRSQHDQSQPDTHPQNEILTRQTDESVSRSSNTDRINREDLPLTLRRDTVKDERENVHQLFVQDSTDDRAKDAERDLETLVGEDVYRLDAREAIYLAGMQNLEDAAKILREWGYDL